MTMMQYTPKQRYQRARNIAVCRRPVSLRKHRHLARCADYVEPLICNIVQNAPPDASVTDVLYSVWVWCVGYFAGFVIWEICYPLDVVDYVKKGVVEADNDDIDEIDDADDYSDTL